MIVDTSTITRGTMDANVKSALSRGHTIDITTTGRKTGEPRRLEIVFHVFDGRIYISGIPSAHRKRAWLWNLEADPAMTFHLKGPVVADLPAVARVITDPVERREVLEKVARVWRRDPDEMVLHSPLIEVTIPGYELASAACCNSGRIRRMSGVCCRQTSASSTGSTSSASPRGCPRRRSPTGSISGCEWAAGSSRLPGPT